MQVRESGEPLDSICSEAASTWGRAAGGRHELQNSKGSCALCCVQMHIHAGECYGFMRRVIKIASKRLVKLMVQVNCMK